MVKRLLGLLYSLYGFIWFLALMLLIFPFIVIASLFGKIHGGNMIYKICRFWADCWFLVLGIRHQNIFEHPFDPTRQYIFVSNHTSYFDIPGMMKAVRKQPVRILAKAETSKVPVFGYIYKSAAVMVDRKNPAARMKSIKILKSVLSKNISIFICPEGTFNMSGAPLKDFYDGAFRIAIETQTPLQPILFPDSYDRLNYRSIFSLTPGRSRAVYLPATETTGLTQPDLPALKEAVYKQMEKGLITYQASWIQNQPLKPQ